MAAPTIQPQGVFGAAFGNSRPDPDSARRARLVERAADDFRLCACHRIAHNECVANREEGNVVAGREQAVSLWERMAASREAAN